MRYLIVRKDSLSTHLTLSGVKYKSLFEKRINQHNTVIIDESFESDITLRFPEYIFEVGKILNDFSRGRLNKIFDLNQRFIYSRPIDKSVMQDLIILQRKEKFQKMTIPDIDTSGAIRITHATYSENVISQLGLRTQRLKDYEKLRTIIFNTTILPYVKIIVF